MARQIFRRAAGSLVDGGAGGHVGIGDPKLTWKPADAGINVATASVYNVTNGQTFVNGSTLFTGNTDWIVNIPHMTNALTINAGNKNVVILGGYIEINSDPRGPANYATAVTSRRALLVQNFANCHIEGLRIGGTWPSDGLNLSTTLAGAIAQVENCRIENLRENLYDTGTDAALITAADGSQPQFNHPDVIQTYGGPSVLRLDKVYGESDREFLTIAPMQGNTNVPVGPYDIRRCHFVKLKHPVITNARQYPFFYTVTGPDTGAWGWTWKNFWYEHIVGARAPFESFFPESDTRWAAAVAAGQIIESAPAVPLVPVSAVGVGYVSPGYQ